MNEKNSSERTGADVYFVEPRIAKQKSWVRRREALTGIVAEPGAVEIPWVL
jgi:hypothetical protein